MLELPEFELRKRQPRAPHVARTVIRRDVLNEHGVPITYEVKQSRSGRDWWVHASREGFRMSNTLHTSAPAKAAAWVRAVEAGQICVGCLSKKSPRQLDREIEESIARLDEKRKRTG